MTCIHIALLVLPAFATATGPGSTALMRQAEHLKPDLDDGVAVSAQGIIVSPRSSATSSVEKNNGDISHKIISEEVQRMTVPRDGESLLETMQTLHKQISRIAAVHMRPHSMGTYVGLIRRYLEDSHSHKSETPDVVVPVNSSGLVPTLSGGVPVGPTLSGSSPNGQSVDMPVDEDGSANAEPVHSSMQLWALGFFSSLLALGFTAQHVGGKMKVQLQPEDDLVVPRGRPCWTICCAAWVVALAAITFFFTLLVLSSVGLEDRADGYDGVVVLHKPRHPGERAFEAGQGVAMSVGLMALLIFRRRHHYDVKISSGLLALCAIRGATLSCGLAALLEVSGISGLTMITGLKEKDLLPTADSLPGSTVMLGVLTSMAVVGLAEEFGKLASLLIGTWLSASAVRLEPTNTWKAMVRVLVESPRAMMLAGLAVGCGFMTLENVGYLLSAGLMYDKDDSAAAERIIRCIIVGVRVGLNLHPWLAGITCARVASLTYGQGRPYLSLSFSELAWALWPAAALHTAFDFGLVSLPGMIAIFLPPFAWIATRHVFNTEWDKCTLAAQDTDPSEDSSAAMDGQSG